MNTPWAEQLDEDLADPAAEGPLTEWERVDSESEWDSPFAPAGSAEAYEGFEAYAPEGGHESEWESPFGEASSLGEEEVMVGPTEFPTTCKDVTMDNKPWPHGLRNLKDTTPGRTEFVEVAPRAEVLELHLFGHAVDRHELKKEHVAAIKSLCDRIRNGIREQRYSGDPIRVFTYGEASSTAPAGHNAILSRNRAFNALNKIRCEFKDAGITVPVHFGFYGTGEQHARFRGPDNKEDAKFRGVLVRTIAPLRASKPCKCPPPPVGQESICVSVPNIAPRSSSGIPPAVIPLGSIVPGLRLPIAIVTRADATVRVDTRRSRQSGQLAFRGWGLEVALPAGRARIDLQADLRASLEVLVRASASLTAKLRLGPLGLVLRIDASAFAQLVVKLCAQLRLRIDVGLGRPNLPELTQCRPVEARRVRGPFPFGALAGPALLIVPGPGYGPAVLSLRGPGVGALGLATDTMLVPADKRTVRTLLAVGGTLQPSGAAGREAELGYSESEWPEAFAEAETEATF